MPKFASLTDPLWKELYRGEVKLSKWQMRDEEWAWMKQVAALSPSDSINVSDILCVRVTLKFETESYSMALRPSTNFPSSAPVIECSYRQGYRFCWTRDSSLLSLVSQFEKYCEELDGALAEIKEMSRSSGEFAFEEKELEIDEEEHIVLRFKIRGSDELITAKIDWRHLDDFPDSLRSTNPARFRDLDPEDWQRDRSLTENFAAICKL